MPRFQKIVLASAVLLGGVASSFAANPRIYQDRHGASYMQDAAGTWYVQSSNDAWHRVQRAPVFALPLRSTIPMLREHFDQAKGDIN
jgi:hypothetical protein